MRWLAFYFPLLPLEVCGDAGELPLAVTRQQGGREQIDRCNPPATAQGIQAGMPLPAALALVPGLQVFPRDERRERQALESLAGWAWQFSSRVSFDPLLLLLEIRGSLKLFGGFDALLQRMQADLEPLGHQGRWALAPTPGGAALLARTRPGRQAADREALRRLLDGVPLAQLTRNRQMRELIRDIGLATIGDCLALPRPELARRTGPELALLLDRLLGKVPDPRPLWQPPEGFVQRLLLVAEINQTEALLFPARRLVESLCAFLRGRGGATQRLEWRFRHREGMPTPLQQGLLAPSRDPEQILELFHQRLERLRLPAPVVEIELKVARWQRFEENTADLFGSRQGVGEGFLDLLRARLGERAVRGLEVVPDHRPERAWRYREPLAQRAEAVVSPLHVRQPVWLLPRPEPLQVRRGGPFYQGALQLQPFSQSIETGWWDEEAVARDYYQALNPAGQRLWIYRERRSGRWFLQGFFD